MRALGLLLVISLAGCPSAGPQPEPAVKKTEGTPVTDATRPPGEVELHGQAVNGKGGAILLLDSKQPVYLERLESWPAELLGKRVVARGRLVQKKHLPEPTGPGGELQQGAVGEQAVLEGATWRAE